MTAVHVSAENFDRSRQLTYPRSMTASRWKRSALGVLLAAITVCALWLLLPRILGLAAEHWLDIPGLESLRVEVDQIGAGQTRLREVRAVYRSAGGHQFTASMHDIVLGYSLSDRRLQRLDIARGELDVTPGKAAQASPWPQIEWPTLPVDDVRIGELQLTLHGAGRQALQARGSAHVRQTDGRLLAELATDSGQARLTATPAPAAGELLELRAEWLPKAGPAANAVLRVGRDPAAQSVTLSAQAALPALSGLARQLGVDLPLDVGQGLLTLKLEAVLGDAAGTLRSLAGDAELAAVHGRLTRAVTPLEFTLAGKLHFLWQASSAQIELQPGLQWRLDGGGKQPLQASGRLDGPYRLRQADGVLRGEDAFPFVLNAQQWGRWDGSLQGLRLQRNTATDGGVSGDRWDAAQMQVRIKGGMKQWRLGAFQATDPKAEGKLALHWSRASGVRGEMALQLGTDGLAWTGDSPLNVRKTAWTANVGATARADGDFWKTLALKGELSAPQMKIEFGAGRMLTLGASRLQLVRLRPGGRKGQPALENAEGELLLAADSAGLAKWPAPGVNVRLRLDGGVLRSDGALTLQAREALRFVASHAIAGGCGEAEITARQPLAALGKALQPRPPALLPLDLRAGESDGLFTLDWCLNPMAKLNAKGRFQLRDGALAWDQAWTEGVQATLQLDGLDPLSGRINFAARRGELATGTPLADLNLDLALGAKSLDVQSLHVQLLGGSVHGGPLSVDWPLTDQPLPLEIRGIDLGLLLALPKLGGLSGSGQLDGVLPFVYHAGGVEIRDGRLRSQGDGTLKYAPTLPIADNPGLQALRNFHFRHFDMRLGYAADGAYRTQTSLEGSNPDFYNGYPIRFGLDINGKLPGLFRAALFSGDFNRHILEQLQSGTLE